MATDRYKQMAQSLSRYKPVEDSNRKLRILMLLLYYHPHPTGLTHYVKTVAESLAQRGHKVTVLAAQHTRATPLGDHVENGVRIVRLWAPVRISRGMLMPSFPWRLAGLLREHDIVNVHMPMLESAFVALAAPLCGVKIVATHHADLVLPKSPINNLITTIMYTCQQVLMRRARCVIAYSEDNADNSFYLKRVRQNVRTIYPPVVIPEPDAMKVRQLQSVWRSNGGPLIGFCGRFAEEKRPDLLIRSLQVINQKYPNARVVFAGENEISYEDTWTRHRKLVERFNSQLIFLGLLRDKKELANFYAACDVLVVPSDTEVFGLVQGEAMLCGTPVVATDIHGGRVAVTVTGMGTLARKGDWRSIGEAALAVLDNPRRFIKPKAAIQGIFSLEMTVDQYESVFYEFASNQLPEGS